MIKPGKVTYTHEATELFNKQVEEFKNAKRALNESRMSQIEETIQRGMTDFAKKMFELNEADRKVSERSHV